jgi:hypothetical protein
MYIQELVPRRSQYFSGNHSRRFGTAAVEHIYRQSIPEAFDHFIMLSDTDNNGNPHSSICLQVQAEMSSMLATVQTLCCLGRQTDFKTFSTVAFDTLIEGCT